MLSATRSKEWTRPCSYSAPFLDVLFYMQTSLLWALWEELEAGQFLSLCDGRVMLGRARMAKRESVIKEALVVGESSGVEVLVEGNVVLGREAVARGWDKDQSTCLIDRETDKDTSQ
jgi:hypothetical protein